MQSVKITWGNNSNPGQIYRSGVEMALCSDDNRQIGTFVYCKDFFQDAILAFLHDKSCCIYGYNYDPKTMPPCPKDNIKVLVGDSTDEKFSEKIPPLLDLLNQFEDKLGMDKSSAFSCENPPAKYKGGVFLVVGDKRWMLAPPALSVWTLLLRNGTRHTIGKTWEETVNGIISGSVQPGQKNDKIFLEYAKPGIDLLLDKGIENLFGSDQKVNYPPDHAGHTMHHYSGAVAWGSGKAKKYFVNWKYPDKETSPPGVCFS